MDSDDPFWLGYEAGRTWSKRSAPESMSEEDKAWWYKGYDQAGE